MLSEKRSQILALETNPAPTYNQKIYTKNTLPKTTQKKKSYQNNTKLGGLSNRRPGPGLKTPQKKKL